MGKFLTLMTVFMLSGLLAFSQNRTVSGTVTDNTGTALPGVSVQVPGTQIGGVTNAQGAFSLNLPASAKELSFSNVGFLTQVVVIPATNKVDVHMQPNPSSLEAVVVTAQGLKTSVKAQGVAQTNLTAEQLTNAKPVNVVSSLSGKVAGLSVAAVSSGVNPTYRLTLRGMRSLLGNNQALVVLDNVIVPSSILGNLNPQDIEGLTVLNGSSAAALYGSDGSNGALIITTKKGSSSGRLQVNVGQTITAETVGIMPKMQKLFGSGTEFDVVEYTPYENQQYGPRFDGSMREVGLPVEDGSIQTIPYEWNSKYGKENFWQTGVAYQTDVSLANNFDRGSVYLAAQYLTAEGTVPGDKYNRATVRLNGNQKLAPKLDLTYSTYYVQNHYDQTSAGSSIYNNVLNTPGQIPLTKYSDWKNDKYANPNGYYNAYYTNPYFLADNYRSLTRNDYFVGSLALILRPIKSVDITYRMGFNLRNAKSEGKVDKFFFSDYTKSIPEQAGTYKVTDILGSYSVSDSNSSNIVSDLMVHTRQKVKDFTFDLTATGNITQGTGTSTSASISGLVVPGLFNISNSLNNPSASNGYSQSRSVSLWGKFDVAYKNYLFLTLTGRNDWFSTLAKENRSFFYPSAQLSFVLTDAIDALKNIDNLDYLKVRAGWSSVGQVSIGPYRLLPTFGQSSGFPYGGQGGFTISTSLVAADLKPELTAGYEVGLDVSLFSNRIKGALTYYDSHTKNQTLSTGVSSATGFSSYLLNVGETSSKGIEASVTVVPYKSDNWFISLGTVYTYYDNKVVSINEDIDKLAIATYGSGAGAYAIAGEQFPVIMGTTYNRDPQGRVIVNAKTGYPSANSQLSILGRASAKQELGLNLEVSYKSLTFAATAAYRGGGYMYNSLASTYDFSGAGANTVLYERERFVFPNSVYEDPTKPGSYIANTNITVREGGSAYWPQSAYRSSIHENYITKSDFWKVREMSLSYALPTKWFEGGKLGVQGVNISVQGRNLLAWLPPTQVYTDPEFSAAGADSNGIGLADLGQMPPSRYYGGTITIKF